MSSTQPKDASANANDVAWDLVEMPNDSTVDDPLVSQLNLIRSLDGHLSAVSPNAESRKKKTSSKNEPKRKSALSSKTINMIKEIQAARIKELQKIEDEEKQRQLNEEKRVEEEEKSILIQKEIERQLQKKIAVTTKSNEPKAVKKRVLYDDRRKGFSSNSDQKVEPVSDATKTELITEQENSSRVKRLRAPVLCVLGHVDAGKTRILDNLCRSHVQANEAGGITQQIGATNISLETLRQRTAMCREILTKDDQYEIPGLLMIDTPGHATFQNLRSRGSSFCDFVILVVDLLEGLKPQTIESIRLLMQKKTPFVIALNKVDLLYGWRESNVEDIEKVIEQQSRAIRDQFERLSNKIFLQFANEGLNVALYYQNFDPDEYYSMVPVSARTGDGMGSLLALILRMCQSKLADRLLYSEELQASVLEVKSVVGVGTVLDVILVNGHLSVGDKIVLAGQDGPIATHIRGLLIPDSNEEMRVTNQFQNANRVDAAQGIRILARGLDRAMAGLPFYVYRHDQEKEQYIQEIQLTLQSALSIVQLKEQGVYVQTSTLGSLEAFLELLKSMNIPYAGVNIGAVHRRDVVQASIQLDKGNRWPIILAFDVPIDRDVAKYADQLGVKILQDDEIYRLAQKLSDYQQELLEENKEKYRHLAVFPCQLRILADCVFNARNPLVLGVRVEEGVLKLGTPICIPSREGIRLGRVTSIEKNSKPMEIAKKEFEVCIRIEASPNEPKRMYGRHFDHNDLLSSEISRESIDILKDYFRDEMQTADWQLLIALKKLLHII